jgi:hypothetical protein
MASARTETVLLPYVMGIGPVEGKVTPARPLWEGASSRLMPALTFGHRKGGAFAFMTPEEVSNPSMQALAMQNLLKVEASWVETEIEDEDGAAHRALVCQDNVCATEKILDSRFMKEGQRLLGAKSLFVCIPVRSVMLVMDGANDGAATMGLLTFGLSLFRSKGEGMIPVTPALFRLKDGRIESFFAEGMEPFADELEAGLQGDSDDDDDDFDDEDDEDPGPTVELATNAPEHWPVVEVPESVLDDPEELSIQVTMALDDGFDDDVEDLGRQVFHMTEGGFVELANEIIGGDRRTGILVYSQATPEAAAHFRAAQEALRQVGVETVYYAPRPLPAAAPGRATVPFSPEILMMRVVAPEPDSYATWWSVPGDESLLLSETYRCIERAYVAMKGFEPVFYARIAKAIEMDGASKRRLLSLPFEEKDAFVRGPDARTLVFSVSAEKGLHFGFPMKDTPLEWRNRFWRLYADGIEAIAAELERAGTVRRTSDPLPLDWLRTAARHNDEMEHEAGEIRVFRLLQME